MVCVPVKYPDSQASTPKHSTTILAQPGGPSGHPPSWLQLQPCPSQCQTLHSPPPSLYPPNLVVQKDRDSERGTSVAPVPALPSLSWPENSTSRIPGHSLPPPAPAIQQSAVLLPTGCPAQRHTPAPPLTPKQTPASSIHEDWVGVGDSESPGIRGLRVPPRPPSHAASLQPCLGGASTRGEEETWGGLPKHLQHPKGGRARVNPKAGSLCPQARSPSRVRALGVPHPVDGVHSRWSRWLCAGRGSPPAAPCT